MTVANKGILVTGGSSGLGLACCQQLAKQGARIAIIDINKDVTDKAVAALKQTNAEVHAVIGDIVEKQAAYKLVDQAIAKLGRVHGVINAAGVYPRKPILEITDADWDFDWGVNVKGTYNVMAAAVEHMRTQPIEGKVRGRIVNVSSVDAFKAHPKNAHYAATKAAVVSLTRSFALEFAPDQILINSIAPAGIATDKAKAAGWLPELASHTPLNRNAEPDDIAEWVTFMLSDANRFMVGENVIVSGGYVFA